MRFGSVCSGIEAASVAWEPLGWKAAWFAEIEPFPCAVLKHHYPDTPNRGDMNLWKEWPDAAIDVLCGGTPCQSFSVAGLRKGLDDPRGNLMLTFLAIAKRHRPRWLVWENVPGVLSSNGGRDFGSFLGGLAECGYGFAYRVLDAQYFGLAQRRKRVFVVAHLGDWRPAAAVLFERESLCGHPAPRREAGKVAPTIPARSLGGGGLGTDFDCDGGVIQAFGGNRTSGPIDVAPALNACGTASGRQDFETEAFITTHTLRGEGFDASEDGTGRGTPLVPVAFSIMPMNSGKDFKAREVEVAQPLMAGGPVGGNQGGDFIAQPLPLPVSFKENMSTPSFGFDKSQTLQAMNFEAVAAVAQSAVAFTTKLHNTTNNQAGKVYEEYTTALDRSSPPPALLTPMQVRRLTPVECERLQGFPDGYTAIPWRNKPADQCPDGPRYKALGNSWAVPVVRWIGERINLVESVLEQQEVAA